MPMLRSGSLASELPFDILLHIFDTVQVLAYEEHGEYSHGGALVGWDSNEELHPLSLVCRGWHDSANAVLYRSVALTGRMMASRFLKTVKSRPDLAARARWLAIGLAEEEERSEGGNADEADQNRAEASRALVEALHTLPNIDHLLIRTLDMSVRPDLLAFFARPRRLTSLVLIARSGLKWGNLLYYEDAALVFPQLKRLDVDVNSSVGAAPLDPSIVFPPFDVPDLEHMCYNADFPSQFTYPFIKPSLFSLYLYFEHLRPAQEAAEVLSRAINLRHLRYTCNPSFDELEEDYDAYRQANQKPTLDLVLPSLLHLETLAVSSTDISSSFLALLPPKLRHVRIHAFSSVGFENPARLLQMLRDPAMSVQSLKEIVIEDSEERWSAWLIGDLRDACYTRGIRFTFAPEIGETDSGSEVD